MGDDGKQFKHSIDIRAHHASLTARYPPGLVPDLANYCHAIRVPLEFAVDDSPTKPLPRALFKGLLDTVAPAHAEALAEADLSATVRVDGEGEVDEAGGNTPREDESQSPKQSIIKSEAPKSSEGGTEISNNSNSKLSDGLVLKPSSEVSSPQSAEIERREIGAGRFDRSGSSLAAAAPAASSTLAARPPAATPPQQQQIIEVRSSESDATTTPEPQQMTRKRSWARAIKEEEKPAEDEEGWVQVKREEGEEGEGEVQVVAKRSRRGKVINGF